jgi:uncharacterized HAD superfamily protein
MKKLAIDIDGVLAHPGKFIQAMCEIIGIEVAYEDFHDHRIDKVFGKSVEEITIAHEKIDTIFSFEDSAPRYGSKKALKRLAQKFEIIILTGRQGRYQEQTDRWIKKHFGRQQIIHASATNAPYANEKDTTKLDICRKLKIDYILEDNPYEINEILKTKTVPVCLAWSVNTEFINHPRIFRGNWREVTEYLLRQFR